MQRRSLRFTANGKFHLIISRERERPFRSLASIKCTGNLHRITVAEIPREPVHPFVCRNCFGALDAGRPFRRLVGLFFPPAWKMRDDVAWSIAHTNAQA